MGRGADNRLNNKVRRATCWSASKLRNARLPALPTIFEDNMRKPVQLDEKTHSIIRKEARRQSTRPGYRVTMGGVIAQLAAKLKRRRK